jgi:hypothetical protein
MVSLIKVYTRERALARPDARYGRAIKSLSIIGMSDIWARVRKMGDQKDIAEMSFEEFFSESKTKAEREANRKAAAAQKSNPEAAPKSQRGFIGATPKINFNNGKFLLYVPRYRGLENDKFAIAVECGDRVVPLNRLESVKQGGSRVTRPSTVDLTPAEVTPMDDFTFTIDGEKAFINKARPISFYNSVGSPVARPMGEVTAVARAGVEIKLFKAELLERTEKNGLSVFKLNVLVSGTAKVDENAVHVEEEAPEEVPEPKVEEAPKEEPKKKPAKKAAVKGGFTMSQASPDADVIYGSERLPLYTSLPIMSVSVTGCEPSDCTVRAEGKDGELLSTSAVSQMYIDTKDYGGPVTLTLEKGAKKFGSFKYFIIPGMTCKYSGKGDITDDTVVEYKVFGQSGSTDVSGEDPYRFSHDGMDFQIVWIVPVVTFDIGNGPQPFGTVDVDILDLKDETMRITVRGARKKALFFGGVSGKKRDITPDWEGDSYDVPLAPIREEVFSSPSSTYCIYITVNSFPNRKFMTIKNPVRVKAKYEEGSVKVDLDPSVKECVCRLYKIDKSVEEVPVTIENPNVPVSQDVIEAEVVELYNGQPRTSISVSVRGLPFLYRDNMGDKWMYVSRSKRIPLPDDLYKDGQPDLSKIRAWHERIVRMNPELKGVTFEMIQKAFKDFQ